MTFGELLKKKRKRLGISQEKMADLITELLNTDRIITGKIISDWECGNHMPHPECWNAIMEGYHVTMDEFADSGLFEAERQKQGDIPSCLFTEGEYDHVLQLVFTKTETDMMRLLNLYCPKWSVVNMDDKKAMELLKNIPAEFWKNDITAEKNAVLHLSEKLRSDAWKNIVSEYTEHEKTGNTFNIRKMPMDCILQLAETAETENRYSQFLLDAVTAVRNGDDAVFIQMDDLGNTEKHPILSELLSIIDLFNADYSMFCTKQGRDMESRLHYVMENPQDLFDEMTDYFCGNWKEYITGHEEKAGIKRTDEDSFAGTVLLCGIDSQPPFYDWIRFKYRIENGKRICTAFLTKKGEELARLML